MSVCERELKKMLSDNFLPMQIKGLIIDPITRMPIIVLSEENNLENVLPIWVGIFEANAIAIKIENIQSPRPMTHDLLNNMLDTLGYNVERVEIIDLKENTYFANIIIKNNAGAEFIIDSRPSDAIALSIRTNSPIFVAKEVLEKASDKAKFLDSDKMQEEDIKRWFESLSSENMNKFKM